MQNDEHRRRSMGFLDLGGATWACFLVTFRDPSGRWKGFFSFRPREEDRGRDEIRTADIFLEDAESEIDRKARGLGRPLLSGLLSSALHTRERNQPDPPALRNWFGEVLSSNSREVAGEWESNDEPADERTLAELRSIYASYRIDQVAHFITLVDPEDFQRTVDTILDGQAFDFSTRDRLQFAMMVVAEIEGLLPLPPFEAWAEDYTAHPEAYRQYTHELHRGDDPE
ncbi:MAG: hypothetical protein EA351_09795 [Gemmatimonadales bacterium]|nr:MAG: hypothetical protein EA351_09795 [Gemmatimonadales bacterium]